MLHTLPVSAVLLLSGCFGSHGMTGSDTGTPATDGGVDSAMVDTGTPPPDAAVDSGRDAGPGLECDPHDIGLVCDHDVVTANRPSRITVKIGGLGQCFCGERVQCVARRGAEPRTLELETGLCADGPLCDGCMPFVEGTCELPPLEEGPWEVTVNGQPSFALQVIPEGVAPEWGRTCATPAVVSRECGILWPPVEAYAVQVCHPAMVPAETHVAIQVDDHCAGCGDAAGPCQVTVFDDIVRVTPSKVYSGCDIDCPDMCMLRSDECVTPPIPEGTYRLIVDGIDGYESELVATPWDTTPAVEYRCGPVHS